MQSDTPNSLAARVKFADVVKRFEKISTTKGLEQKYEIIRKFFKSIVDLQKRFREEEGEDADASFYPFLRLFLPHKDLERGSYGIKNYTLGRLFVKALAITEKSEHGQKLTNLKGVIADYGDIVFEVMKFRSPENGTLSVYEVNKYLDLIADHFEEGERNKIENEVVKMFSKMSALDRKWLTRILLKKLNLGAGPQKILEIYHPNANELYNQCSLLSRICEVIDKNLPKEYLQSGLIELFKPIRPMLCERGYIPKINQMLSENEYYLETKMDGERCMVHTNGTEFKYFSRTCKDELTKTFGATKDTGLYSPFLHSQLNRNVKNAIFDGELMVWDRENEVFCKKAENHTAKFLTRTDERYNTCFVIYDLIYYNDENLSGKPYAERIRRLHTIINPKVGALMLCKREKIRDTPHFLECLNKAFDANEEGVVIKQEDSKYRPGQREQGGWFKIKPDYEDNLISDFDLMIIGGYYNENKTKVDSYLLGVLKKAGVENSCDVFYSVCKIRNGLTHKDFVKINEHLQPHKHNLNNTKNRRNSVQECPAGIEWANANPDFWVDPKKSIVLQIKASHLSETNTYRTSHLFRFPRVMEIRWDKQWYDTCSLNEFQTFCSSDAKLEQLTKRHATSSDLIGAPVPKRQKEKISPKTSQSKSSTSTEVEAIDNICKGLDFCISNVDKKAKYTIENLKYMVRRHGGKVVDYPTPKTFVTITGDPNILKIKQLVNKKIHNIAKQEWLIRALGSDKPLKNLIKFTSEDMIYATDELKEQFAVGDEMSNEHDSGSIDNDDDSDQKEASNESEAIPMAVDETNESDDEYNCDTQPLVEDAD